MINSLRSRRPHFGKDRENRKARRDDFSTVRHIGDYRICGVRVFLISHRGNILVELNLLAGVENRLAAVSLGRQHRFWQSTVSAGGDVQGDCGNVSRTFEHFD